MLTLHIVQRKIFDKKFTLKTILKNFFCAFFYIPYITLSPKSLKYLERLLSIIIIIMILLTIISASEIRITVFYAEIKAKHMKLTLTSHIQ